MAIDFDPWQTQARFDVRGCCVEWRETLYKICGERYRGVGFNAPPWIREEVQAEIRRRGGKRVGVRESDWPDHFYFESRVPQAVTVMLEQLGTAISIGRTPPGVDHCFALDYYKVPDEDLDPMQWPNTEAGELVNRSKYWSNATAINTLVEKMAKFVQSQPVLVAADCVISVPGQHGNRTGHGERLAAKVADATEKPFYRTKALYDERKPAKEGGAPLRADQVEADSALFYDDKVIIVDDVFRSGSSMKAVASSARSRGAVAVYGFAAARTMRN